MALENCGDVIAWLAKVLNPFSISPIILRHNTKGSLLLSAMGVLHQCEGFGAAFFFFHTTPLRRAGQHRQCRAWRNRYRWRAFCAAENHAIQVPVHLRSEEHTSELQSQ